MSLELQRFLSLASSPFSLLVRGDLVIASIQCSARFPLANLSEKKFSQNGL
jgi:hypothetical protein